MNATLNFASPVTALCCPSTIADALIRPRWAIVTATIEKCGPHDSETNLRQTEKLRAHLKRFATAFVSVSGFYKGVYQGESFLVEMGEADARYLCTQFYQESFLCNRGIVYTDGTLSPVNGETLFGVAATQTGNYTQIEISKLAFSLAIDLNVRIKA